MIITDLHIRVDEFLTGPCPSTLVANTLTEMLLAGRQDDEEISNMWVHVSFIQEDGCMVALPQMLPEFRSK